MGCGLVRAGLNVLNPVILPMRKVLNLVQSFDTAVPRIESQVPASAVALKPSPTLPAPASFHSQPDKPSFDLHLDKDYIFASVNSQVVLSILAKNARKGHP